MLVGRDQVQAAHPAVLAHRAQHKAAAKVIRHILVFLCVLYVLIDETKPTCGDVFYGDRPRGQGPPVQHRVSLYSAHNPSRCRSLQKISVGTKYLEVY